MDIYTDTIQDESNEGYIPLHTKSSRPAGSSLIELCQGVAIEEKRVGWPWTKCFGSKRASNKSKFKEVDVLPIRIV